MTTEAHSTRNAVHWKRSLTMRDVMTSQPLTIGREQTLATAHKIMRDHEVRHLPVLHAGGIVGILSQRDLYFLETIRGVELDADLVEDAMSPDVYEVSPEDALRKVAQVMAARRLGCAVVVENGHAVGIFTANDALRLIAQG